MPARQDLFQIAEGLAHLDPVGTYPNRAAKLIAGLVDACAYRLDLKSAGQLTSVSGITRPPPDVKPVSLPLRYGRREIGAMHLYLRNGGNSLEASDLQLARWGARSMARGISYINRMVPQYPGSVPGTKSGFDGIVEYAGCDSLTIREKQFVSMLMAGGSTRGIAGQTGLTTKTVRTYFKRIFAKLGVHSRVELIAYIRRSEGRIPPLPPLPQIEVTAEYGWDGDRPPSKMN